MRCEFEEKHYEQPLNAELKVRGSIIFSPGQVLENKLGIDAGLFSINPIFWNLWRNRSKFSLLSRQYRNGIYLKKDLWNRFGQEINDSTFPKFKFNVFIQHKRPEYLIGSRAYERNYWNQPYFRYYIDEDQQTNLFNLENNIASQGIVVYGCPAFWKFDELWRYAKSHSLVENSNFVQPHNLNGHDCYTFINRGTLGKAFSESKEVKNYNLLESITSFFEKKTEATTNTQFIFLTAKKIERVVNEANEKFQSYYYQITENFEFRNDLAISFAHILAFIYLTNVSWGIAAMT